MDHLPAAQQTTAVLFDLDGTLLDTAMDLGSALNAVLAAHNFPLKSYEEYRPFASHGSLGLLRLGFGSALETKNIEELKQEFLTHYAANMCVHTKLFKHADVTLKALTDRGIGVGIVTNKPTRFTIPLLTSIPILGEIEVVICGDTLPVNKPDPAPLLLAAKKLNVPPSRCLYVGDAERDIVAGERAGMKTVLAAYGYLGAHDNPANWKADYTIATLDYLIDIITEAFPT